MKHLLQTTLTATLLASAVVGQAQSHQPQSREVKNLFRKGRPQINATAARGVNSLTVPGRRVSHAWDDQTNRWTDGLIMTSTYNGQGKPEQIVEADSATNQPYTRVNFTYNAQGLLTERVTQDWTGSTYVNVRREQRTYDAQGRVTQELEQAWMGSAFVNEYRYQSTYDARGTETLYLVQEWVNNAWQTNYGFRSTHTYNTAGERTSTVYEDFDSTTNTWQVNDRELLTLNANNEWVEVVYQEWTNGAFVNEERVRNITWHNWSQFLPSYFEVQEWNTTSNTWGSDARTTCTYQPNGSFVYLRQNLTASNTWVNDERNTLTNDNYGNTILEQDEVWANGAWVIDWGYRNILAYTAANLVRRSVEQSYDDQLRRFVNEYVSTFGNFITLASRKATGLEAALYPNPTLSTATFRLPGLVTQQTVKAEVVNTMGQVLQTVELRPQQGVVEHSFDLSQRPAGLYTVRLHTSQGTVVKSIIKR